MFIAMQQSSHLWTHLLPYLRVSQFSAFSDIWHTSLELTILVRLLTEDLVLHSFRIQRQLPVLILHHRFVFSYFKQYNTIQLILWLAREIMNWSISDLSWLFQLISETWTQLVAINHKHIINCWLSHTVWHQHAQYRNTCEIFLYMNFYWWSFYDPMVWRYCVINVNTWHGNIHHKLKIKSVQISSNRIMT